MWFETKDINEKLTLVESMSQALMSGQSLLVPDNPGRDVQVVELRQMPDKPGLSKPKGQARLLHDLANIELQAMELAFRTLAEFPDAPQEFREQLLDVALDEARHLQLCLEGLEHFGYQWGEWPVHLSLWGSVSCNDSLIDRLLIVHRYLEGSGLDAGESLLRKLSGTPGKITKEVVAIIAQEEMGHVQFGSRWFTYFAKKIGQDPESLFINRLAELRERLPKRLEKIQAKVRIQAGFSLGEIEYLKNWREQLL